MTIEEKLQHFYDTSVTEAQEQAQKELDAHKKSLDEMLEKPAQKEKGQPDISCLRTPPVLSPANRRTGRLFDHFAGKTPEIFRTVPGNRCANRLYGTFARQRGDIVRQHRNDNHECRGPTVGRRSFGSADYCHQGSNDHPPVLSAR